MVITKLHDLASSDIRNVFCDSHTLRSALWRSRFVTEQIPKLVNGNLVTKWTPMSTKDDLHSQRPYYYFLITRNLVIKLLKVGKLSNECLLATMLLLKMKIFTKSLEFASRNFSLVFLTPKNALKKQMISTYFKIFGLWMHAACYFQELNLAWH